MAEHKVNEELWDEFHTVVNMSSRELTEWLRTAGAGEADEAVPDEAGPETGRQVAAILGKRRTDLTDDDIATMEKVVRRIREERRGDLEPTAGQSAWRHRLMSLGHDPLKGT